MKTKSTFLLVLLISMNAVAQHPLVGTWEMVSVKGLNTEGKPFTEDRKTNREIKIITATHYILIAHTVKGDSVKFNRCIAGTVKIDGTKYIETPTLASWSPMDIVSTDFTWKVEGEHFIQSGTINLADGKKVVLEKLVFRRLPENSSSPNNPLVGVWNQLSSDFTLFDGTKGAHTSPAVTRFYLYTPTHWMMIGHWEGKFQNAMGGSYIVQGNKLKPDITVASFDLIDRPTYDITHRLEGGKLYVNGKATRGDGKQMEWNDVYEKVSGPGK